MVFSQGSGSGFGYDYTRQYTRLIMGEKGNYYSYLGDVYRYILPEDSFVTASDSFLINGGQCSRYLVDSASGSGSGNHYTSWTDFTYINFAFCKKGDVITSTDGHQEYPLGGKYYSYSGTKLTIIPARK